MVKGWRKKLVEEAEKVKVLFSCHLSGGLGLRKKEADWIGNIVEVLSSKTYVSGNVDDILWFGENGLNTCGSVLDFGCGSGYLSYLLSFMVDKVWGCEYMGKWVDQTMSVSEYKRVFNYCWRKLENKKNDLSFFLYKEFPLKLNANSIDGVVMYAVLEHLEASVLESVMWELSRLTKDGGYLFIAKLPRLLSFQENVMKLLGKPSHSRLFTAGNIIKLLERYGYVVEKIECTGLFFNHPNQIVNLIYPLTIKVENFVYRHFKVGLLFSHDYRLVARKVSIKGKLGGKIWL